MWVSYSAIAPAGVGEHRAAEADHDVPVAGQQVDALERVVRVTDDRVGLLDPVERCPLDDDPAAQVGVVGANAAAGTVCSPTTTSNDSAGVWCHSKCTGPSTGGSRSGTSARRTARAWRRRRPRGTAYIGTTRRGSQTSAASVGVEHRLRRRARREPAW